MSQAEIELGEVKAIIRGLLVSSTVATSIRQLESDYRKQEGISLPCRTFGYPSTEAFLRSIPDTVHLREPSRGCPASLIIVEPVQSKNSEHVEKMVIRQKTSKPVRGMKRSSAIPESKAQYRASNDSTRLNGMAPRFIPLALRASLSRVCQRYAPQGLPLSSLGSELSRDLAMAGWVEKGKAGWLCSNGFSSLQEVIDGLRDQGLIKITHRNGQEWVLSTLDQEMDGHKTSEEVEKGRNLKSPNGVMIPAGAEMETDDEWSDDDIANLVSDRMKKNFRDILAKYPDGLWCSALPKEYKLLTGSDLDVKQIGFVSIVQMASKLKDVFICSRPVATSDWMLFDSRSNALWNSPAAPSGRGHQLPTLPSKFIRNIEALLEDHPNGIERAKFMVAYKAKYHEDFPFIDFGFENLMAVIGHLAKRNVVHLRFSGYIPMVCKPYTYAAQEDVFSGLKKDDDFISALYPMGVVGYKECIPLQELPEDLAPGCSFDVQVTEVESPSKFWFQIFSSDLHNEFEEMMDRMQDFYSSNGPTVYRIPDAAIMIGQYCVAKFPPDPAPDAEWHRGIIQALPSMTDATVYYVDYGSVARIPRSEIYFLDSRFSKLPMQARTACLTNIRPVGYGLWKEMRKSCSSNGTVKRPSWSRDCMPFFIRLIGNKPSVAAVTHIRQSDCFLSLGLTDTSGEDDKHINDIFVSANLAEFGEMTDEEDNTPVLGPLKPASYRPPGYVENEYNSPCKTPLASQRPMVAENGYQYDDNMSCALKTSYADECSATYEYDESYLSEQSHIKVPRNEDNMKLMQLMEEQNRLEEGKRLAKIKRQEQERRMEEARMSLERLKMEEVQRLAEEREVEERRLKDMQRLEEMKRLQLEAQERLEEQRKLEELRRLEEQKKLEEKAKQESQLRLELQKLQIQQKLLEVQQQQYQAQLLFLNSQNGLGAMITPGMSSLLGTQALLPAPPPGLMNPMSLANIQPELSQLLAAALQGNSFTSGMTDPFQSLASPGNFSLPNQAYMPWSNAGSDLGNPQPFIFGGAGDNFASKPKVFTPPGFENFHKSGAPLNAIPTVATPTFNDQNLVSVGISGIGSTNFIGNGQMPLAPMEPVSTPANCPNKVPDGAANSNSLQKTHSNNSFVKAEIPSLPVNISKSHDSQLLSDQYCDKPIHIPDSANTYSGSVAVVDRPDCPPKTMSSFQPEVESSSVHSAYPRSDMDSSKSTNSVIKPKPRSLNKEAISELNALLRSCKNNSKGKKRSSSAVKENSTQERVKIEEKKPESDAKEKWMIEIETPSSKEEDTDFMKGCLEGKTVNVIKVNGTKCVLTEEILGLFFNNLPVHVALKIAELRPNGHKIKSVTLNPLKDRNLCKEISRLNVIEVNPKGSDVHLVTVESLHYLCAALGEPA